MPYRAQEQELELEETLDGVEQLEALDVRDGTSESQSESSSSESSS